MKQSLILDFPLLYDDENITGTEYFDLIPKEKALLIAATLIAISKPNSPFLKIEYFIQKFFSKENSTFSTTLYEKITLLRKKYHEVTLINPLSSLQIAEYILSNSKKETPDISHEFFEQILVKGYLKFNEKNNVDKVITPQLEKIDDFSDKWAVYSMTSMLPYSDITNFDIINVVMTQFVKAVYLFQFMDNDTFFKPVLSKFLEDNYCVTWIEYLQKLLHFIFLITKSTNRFTKTEHIVLKDKDFDQNCNFIDTLILNGDDDSSKKSDFISLRGKPLYKFGEGEYRVISELFLVEKLYSGLFFALNNANRKLDKGVRLKDFRAMFCEKFIENSLFYSTLKEIYKNRHLQFSGEKIKELFSIDAEPDFYIRNGNKILLFESKDVLMNAKIKVSYNFGEIENALKSKLYYEQKNEKKMSNKAILQLLNNVKNILKNNLVFDKNVKGEKAKIYPIIITYNRVFDTPAINFWINKWYEEELSRIGKEGINTDNVRRVTIINIDTLILYSELLKRKDTTLENLIDSYHKLQIIKRPKRISIKKGEELFLGRYISFSEFVKEYCRKNNLVIKEPKIFLEKGKQMIAKMVK